MHIYPGINSLLTDPHKPCFEQRCVTLGLAQRENDCVCLAQARPQGLLLDEFQNGGSSGFWKVKRTLGTRLMLGCYDVNLISMNENAFYYYSQRHCNFDEDALGLTSEKLWTFTYEFCTSARLTFSKDHYESKFSRETVFDIKTLAVSSWPWPREIEF